MKEMAVKIGVVVSLIIAFICGWAMHDALLKKEERYRENMKSFSEDDSFYLQNGKLFSVDSNSKYVCVPGDFSQMSLQDYKKGTYQSNPEFGGIYFYYKTDGHIFLVRTENYKDWQVKELTTKEIGMEEDSKIKYIRIYGVEGYIFYINKDGKGKILYSSTYGDYWSELKTDFELSDECELKFLNEFGMTTDGFLTVPSENGCDLYSVNGNKLSKVDIGKNLRYYNMPSYLNGDSMNLVVEVGESKENKSAERFISRDEGYTWITESEYYNQLANEKTEEKDYIVRYNNMANNLDTKVFLTDFKNYLPDSNEVKISEEKAKEIAESGFKESASRIAGEGIDDTEKEYIKIKEVSPNNYFTRKYSEGDDVYTSIKRKAYVVTKENSMGNGVSVYVDANTGLIIGGEAFGD